MLRGAGAASLRALHLPGFISSMFRKCPDSVMEIELLQLSNCIFKGKGDYKDIERKGRSEGAKSA